MSRDRISKALPLSSISVFNPLLTTSSYQIKVRFKTTGRPMSKSILIYLGSTFASSSFMFEFYKGRYMKM